MQPLAINFFGVSMHFPHQPGKSNGKINWIGSSDQFGPFWATLIGGVVEIAMLFLMVIVTSDNSEVEPRFALSIAQ